MQVTFHIDFHTRMGQQVFVVGSAPELGKWNENKAVGLNYENGCCRQTIEIKNAKKLSYRYFVKDSYSGELVYERGAIRHLTVENKDTVFAKDYWKAFDGDNSVYKSSLFTKVLHKRSKQRLPKKEEAANFILQIYAPKVQSDEDLYVVGSHRLLGNWNEKKAVRLSDTNFPLWSCHLKLEESAFPMAYKYLIKKRTGEMVAWEEGENREITYYDDKVALNVQSDENLRIYGNAWRGAGVSIPVFSLRSETSYGVGEFLDIKKMVDWASSVGMNLIQVLPINDTTVTHTWADSYPYKPISVFALHPMYLNIPSLKRMTAAEKLQYEKEQQTLNALSEVDYEQVNKQKLDYARTFFTKQKQRFLKNVEFQDFFLKNKDWLQPYAAFCYLRDKYKTANFTQWGTYAKYSTHKIAKLTSPQSKDYHEISFYYYLQFHLDKQLKEAVAYARSKNVALKGDIPIGIGGESVDAWQKPQLFNLGTSAGAPPDAFAVRGQNWGFPTYNWEEMAKDNFCWWKQRFQKMADYFDAYRIDHILGFFRIWEIPADAEWGLLGHFNKALPFSAEEMAERGIWLDYERYCKPYIREHILYELFSEHTQYVKDTFLNNTGYESYELKHEFNTQKKLSAYFENKEQVHRDTAIKDGLMSLPTEVLFVVDPINSALFHPRISLHSTLSYRDLNEDIKEALNKLYIDFFYHRHEEFWWQQAMQKLPTLVEATDMLVCGEDLGMVPDCVPDVMWQLKILSLEIQRMPKSSKVKFGNPSDAPYLSVCTTSTHDMSSIRAWWEEDRVASQEFYHTVLGRNDDMPYFAEPWLCEAILQQHLDSKAMLTVFPLQDLLAIDANLRTENPEKERINIPSNPKHYWRYRMHLSLEKLKRTEELNNKLEILIKNSGR